MEGAIVILAIMFAVSFGYFARVALILAEDVFDYGLQGLDFIGVSLVTMLLLPMFTFGAMLRFIAASYY